MTVLDLRIEAEISYRYSGLVTVSPQILRLHPRAEHGLRIRRCELRTDPACEPHWRRDAFDNVIATCFFPRPDDHLRFALSLDLVAGERNPFGFLLAAHALEFPFAYTAEERRRVAGYLAVPEEGPLPLPFWQPPAGARPGPTVPVLAGLNTALHRAIAYERREEGPARAPEETLALGRGACRDVAWLLVRVLRGLGLGARMASGYLVETGVPEAERKAEGALHAWAEVYVPGAGWIGMDPTNGVLADHHFIAAAVGIVPEDVAPVSGHYYSDTAVASRLDSRLSIQAR